MSSVKSFEEIVIDIERRKQMFHWFIDNIKTHGISWNNYDYLTPDYVERLIKMRKPRPIDTNETLCVDGAHCIVSGNKTWDGKELLDIGDRFPDWMAKSINQKINSAK